MDKKQQLIELGAPPTDAQYKAVVDAAKLALNAYEEARWGIPASEDDGALTVPMVELKHALVAIGVMEWPKEGESMYCPVCDRETTPEPKSNYLHLASCPMCEGTLIPYGPDEEEE